MPDSFATTDTGVTVVVNGIDAPVKWDGATDLVQPVGLPAPAAAPGFSLVQKYTLTEVTGTGGLIGRDPYVETVSVIDDDASYRAFYRYYDAAGRFSDLSPVAEPDDIETLTEAVARVSRANGNAGFTPVLVSTTIRYTIPPPPGESRAAGFQVLRNTSGQLGVFYVDVDSTDFGAGTYASTKTDDQLRTSEAVPLFGTSGEDLANRYGLPPNHKPFVASHLSRLWLAGTATYAEGSARLTGGGATVTGDGTEWREEFVGRFFFPTGTRLSYEITAVDEANQTLTLASAYEGADDPFAAYAIRPAQAEAPLLYFSEAGQPDAWPAFNALSLPDDGDEITGLMPRGSFLYVLKRRRVYRVSAAGDPVRDGFVFLSASRGCVNNRCWVVVGEQALLLDESGVWAFTGGEARELSAAVQPVFYGDGRGPKINWAAARWFHASHDLSRQSVRWHVTMQGEYLPRHALCYSYSTGKWWVEEYPWPVGASCVGRSGRPTAGWADGGERWFFGGPAGQVYVADGRPGDGADPGPPLAVASAGVDSVTVRAVLPAGVVGAPVVVASGRGAGQVRVIAAASGGRIELDRPWAVKPNAQSTVQIGGIAYRYVTARMRLAPSQEKQVAALEMTFDPAENPARLTLTFDRRPGPTGIGTSLVNRPVTATKGDTHQDIDLSGPNAAAYVRFDRHREFGTPGARYVQVGIAGASGQTPVAFGETTFNGVV